MPLFNKLFEVAFMTSLLVCLLILTWALGWVMIQAYYCEPVSVKSKCECVR